MSVVNLGNGAPKKKTAKKTPKKKAPAMKSRDEERWSHDEVQRDEECGHEEV